MSARAKFLFDTDFAQSEGLRPGFIPLAQHQAALAEAEARGHRTGLAAGRAEAATAAERATAAALGRAAAALEALAGGIHAAEARIEAEAVEVAAAVGCKLAASLIAREPLAEIAALAAECFRHLVGAPHVAVRVNDAVYEIARTALLEIAQRCGFDGRLVVLADPEIAAGDCRIEWADGGVVRSQAAIEAAIDEAVAQYLSGRRAASGATESWSGQQ